MQPAFIIPTVFIIVHMHPFRIPVWYILKRIIKISKCSNVQKNIQIDIDFIFITNFDKVSIETN